MSETTFLLIKIELFYLFKIKPLMLKINLKGKFIRLFKFIATEAVKIIIKKIIELIIYLL